MDPDYAPTVEVFDNLTHEQIHAGVSLLDPSALQTGGQLWQGAATGLNDAVNQAHTEISGAISDGWRGAAAGLAGAAVRDFEAAGRQLADVLATVGQRLGQAGDAAETLRTGIGEPSGVRPDLPAALLDPHAATGNIAAQQAAETERADAVRVMESVYLGAFIPTGAQVPAFPDLPVSGPGDPDAPTPAGEPDGPAASATGMSSPVAKVVSYASVSTGETSSAPVATGATAADPDAAATSALTGAPGVPAGAPTVPAPAEQPPATTAAGTQLPGSAATATPVVSGGSTPVAAAGAPAAPVFAVPVRPAGAGPGSDSARDRDREEQQRDPGGDAITGMGAGAIGGMMGGAMAADTVRANSPAAPVRTEQPADEDDLHFGDDELTFLEEGEPGGQLIGTLDPTTPPVLGEWTDSE
ncbi:MULTISPECIES: WXG100 family type VII secretion target [Nocardia]|uniref:WXG100 family type VII secretion target n=1 Tax=Nocardia TaxID=1817 RepID=UPI0018954926|nr:MULTISPECIES: hypothetical protein [Nocardia]MBF6350778.1 hypothetical protein [Nocardia flavorosea]